MRSLRISFAVHAVTIALVLLFGSVVRHVLPVPVLYHEVLVLPISLPVPQVRPVAMRHFRVEETASHPAQSTATLNLAPRVKVSSAAPVMVQLAAADAPKLPVAASISVKEAPQVKATGSVSGRAVDAGFGNTTGNGAPSQGLGVARSTGFGSGSSSGNGRGTGTVKLAAFSEQAASLPTTARLLEPPATAPVITYEPRPLYTAEANQLRIQGEITVQVCLLATGQAEVVRVVSGLGHGLDESAIHVIEGLRFVPATQGGRPVNKTVLVHITFQLAQ
jgi:TonB family protein